MKQLILQAIENTESGCISYADFMELALYHPSAGYYMKGQTKIGKSGDFYTSSSVSDVFAEIIGTKLVQLIQKGLVPPIILEIGGGNGTFAKQVLHTWKELSPDTFIKGKYILIEASPFHKELIQEQLQEFDNVELFNQIKDAKECFPTFKGIIFSNEFFDALPVHVIKKQNGAFHEIMIGRVGAELVEMVTPLCNDQILSFVEKYGVELKEGQRYEIPLVMDFLFLELSSWVEEGLVITIDYGYSDHEWGLPFHSQGSLRGYYKHQMIEDPLKNVGEMDLTTHIHFDKLIKAGEWAGFTDQRLVRQDEFLIESGILHYLQDHVNNDPFSEVSKKNRAIRSLIMQGGISSSFRVLLQTKGIKIEDFLT
ncbi:class I SAM-dependent methyltransferase [Bacillus salitolerans]|uniref:Class I SAM-dependent methyltransferase n=1 Tax=Bacillus salitolerans TaxID=1437434 RepID=A0ABW4LMZ1_9BACI